MLWFWKNYCGSQKLLNEPRALPLLTKDLSGLPRTIILSAEYDPLRDDARHFAARLAEAGVSVKLKEYADAFHGFWNLAGVLPAGRLAISKVPLPSSTSPPAAQAPFS